MFWVLFDILDLEDKISNNSNRGGFVVAEISSDLFETGSNNISNELNTSTTMNSEGIFNSNEVINDCILLEKNSNGKF